MCWWIEIRDLKLFNLAILAKSNLVLASQPTFLVLSKLLSVFFFSESFMEALVPRRPLLHLAIGVVQHKQGW